MASSILFEEQLEVPLNLRSLEEFRHWALSDYFPDRGRIDYIDGRVEVDMSPEEIYSHGVLKSAIVGALWAYLKTNDLGILMTDSMRISSVEAALSAEPDVVFVSYDSLKSGRVQRTPKASGEAGRYVELQGGPDLVVEIVSDSSIIKDTRRLPAAYFAADVLEYWLVDARQQVLSFQIHRRGDGQFESVECDDDGYQPSNVFNRRFRIVRSEDQIGDWKYDLLDRPE